MTKKSVNNEQWGWETLGTNIHLTEIFEIVIAVGDSLAKSLCHSFFNNVSGVTRGVKINPLQQVIKLFWRSRFCTGVQPSNLQLKYSPSGRSLGMGDPGNGGPTTYVM